MFLYIVFVPPNLGHMASPFFSFYKNSSGHSLFSFSPTLRLAPKISSVPFVIVKSNGLVVLSTEHVTKQAAEGLVAKACAFACTYAREVTASGSQKKC